MELLPTPFVCSAHEEEGGRVGRVPGSWHQLWSQQPHIAQLSPLVPSCLPTCPQRCRANGTAQPGAWNMSCQQGRFVAMPSSSPAVGLTACQGRLAPWPLTCVPVVSNPLAIWFGLRVKKHAAFKKIYTDYLHRVEEAHGHFTFMYL